jgi:hypothetical protein
VQPDLPEIDEDADLEHIRRTEELVRRYKAKELHEIGEELCNLSSVSALLGVAIRIGERAFEEEDHADPREAFGDLLVLLQNVRTKLDACATWNRIHEHAAAIATLEALKEREQKGAPVAPKASEPDPTSAVRPKRSEARRVA